MPGWTDSAGRTGCIGRRVLRSGVVLGGLTPTRFAGAGTGSCLPCGDLWAPMVHEPDKP